MGTCVKRMSDAPPMKTLINPMLGPVKEVAKEAADKTKTIQEHVRHYL